MHTQLWFKVVHYSAKPRSVQNVSFLKKARTLRIPRISAIEIHNIMTGLDKALYEVRAYKAGSPGNKDSLHYSSLQSL
jgi:hypothetical protein